MSVTRSQQTSRKSMKVLGVSAAQLIGKVLDGDARLGAGALDRDEFALFWAGLAGDSTEFLTVCIRTLQEAIDGRRVLSFPWHALVNTIAFLAFRFRIRDNAPLLRQTLADVKNARYDRAVFSAADEVLRTVFKRLVEGDPALDTLLIQMSTLYSATELTTLADHLHFPTLDGNKVSGGELAFVYHYLRDLAITDSDVCGTVLERAVFLLSALPQTLKINTILAETKLLAVLHLISEIVIRRPDSIRALSERLCSALQPFLLWPSPTSNCVQRTLFLIQQEGRFPGVNLLERVLDESHGAVLGLDLSTGEAVAAPSIPLFYLLDSASLSCSQAYKVLGLHDIDVDEQLGRFKRLAPGISADTKAQLIAALLGAGEVDAIRSRPDLDALFDDVVGVVRDAVGRLDDNIDGRLAAHRAGMAPSDTRSWPPLASFTHIGCVDTIWYRMAPKSTTGRASFPITPLHDRLRRIVQHMAAATASAIKPVVLHLICCGSVRLLHALACAYLALRQDDADRFRDLDVRFYVVPVDDNLLASYLGRHDAWYHRHVYQPFRARPFLLPYLSSSEIEFTPRRSTGDGSIPMPPGLFLRDAVEMFVRESFDIVPVQVYRIECWDSRDTSSSPDHTIPLLARLEISVRVEARYYQKSQQDPRKLSEIVKSVGLPQPQLLLQYAKMNVFGACTATVSLESIVYDGVVLANVPISKDPCFPANPAEKYLEMYAQCASQTSSVTSSTSSRKGRPGGNYGELRCRVGLVDVTAFETPFSVLIDNSLFGPFFRLVVSAEDLSLPFRSLFPIASS